MRVTSIIVSIALLLPSAVLTAPIDYEAADMYERFPAADLDSSGEEIFARAIQATINVRPDPGKDFANILTGRASVAMKASYAEAAALTTLLLKRADATLRFGKGKIDVQIQSTYHENLAHDPHRHYTFAFFHPSCGGQCRGHAYRPSGGRIYNAAHNMVLRYNFEGLSLLQCIELLPWVQFYVQHYKNPATSESEFVRSMEERKYKAQNDARHEKWAAISRVQSSAAKTAPGTFGTFDGSRASEFKLRVPWNHCPAHRQEKSEGNKENSRQLDATMIPRHAEFELARAGTIKSAKRIAGGANKGGPNDTRFCRPKKDLAFSNRVNSSASVSYRKCFNTEVKTASPEGLIQGKSVSSDHFAL
ncbi:hypothetical protein BKA70DRAFT_1214069 [Coprinopsis sp. MPI-PUGE-AT-0042]|nr:hypothetical protein BKA70DRAFT_1214069 [Coprinopsis sp. MPI-PUGE-AT-0042]